MRPRVLDGQANATYLQCSHIHGEYRELTHASGMCPKVLFLGRVQNMHPRMFLCLGPWILSLLVLPPRCLKRDVHRDIPYNSKPLQSGPQRSATDRDYTWVDLQRLLERRSTRPYADRKEVQRIAYGPALCYRLQGVQVLWCGV